jgi:hypothetical protein
MNRYLHTCAARRLAGAAVCLAMFGGAGAALAAPEEIQVYMDEMSRPGDFGLDVHVNYVVSGNAVAAYPGAQGARHTLRVTPEFSYGWTPDLELGAYLLTSRDADRNITVDGQKLRLKYIAPRAADQPFYVGANLELGRVAPRLDQNPWNGELKGIAGYRGARWSAALNANLDFKVSGPVASAPSLELASKLAYQAGQDVQIGIESYDGMGPLRRLGRLGAQEHSLYAVLDTSARGWDLNLGLGRGSAGASDRWVVKAVLGVPIGK